MTITICEIGTSNPPTNINTVLAVTPLTGDRPPRTEFYEAGSFSDRLDGHVSGAGYPKAVWTFDVLRQSMVDKLRVICPNCSAGVYISTIDNTGTYKTYSAIMVWPVEQSKKRQIGGKYLGLQFEFRHLELVTRGT